MYVKLYAAHLAGLNGEIIEIEVDIASGLPHFDIVGLPGSALKESKERVRSAIRNSGYTFPMKRITINLAPAHIRKEGSYFDLAIALSILLADEQLKLSKKQMSMLDHSIFMGELALDGSTRQSPGLFSLVLAAKEHQFKKIFLPAQHYLESQAIVGSAAVPINHLNELVAYFKGKLSTPLANPSPGISQPNGQAVPPGQPSIERIKSEEELIETISGQDHIKRAFEVAAAGFHHMLLMGPPGSGKTMLAKRFIHLLPPLNEKEAIEVTKIMSVADLLPNYQGIWKQRLFRAPHHSVTITGMIGGGTPIKPGEVSIAHHGILFLDEFLEFKRPVMEALREPLEDRQVTITRGNQSYTFPSSFLFIVALNPCPCGYYGYESEQKECRCLPSQIERYRQKLSGPIYDRIDLHLEVPFVGYEQLVTPTEVKQDQFFTTMKMKSRIKEAIQYRQMERKVFKANGLLSASEINHSCRLTRAAQDLIKEAFHTLPFSARSYHKILKIGRTIADLDQKERVDEEAIAEALFYRTMDRQA